MKIILTFKTPDVLDAIVDQVNSEYEDKELRESNIEEAKAVCKKWVRFEEYLTVEVDTDNKTCRVIPNEIGHY